MTDETEPVDELAARRVAHESTPQATQVCAGACKTEKPLSAFGKSRKNPGRRTIVCIECSAAAAGTQSPGQRRAKRQVAEREAAPPAPETMAALERFGTVTNVAELRDAMQDGLGTIAKVMFQRALAGDAAALKLCLEVAGAKDSAASEERGLDEYLADDPGAATDTA